MARPVTDLRREPFAGLIDLLRPKIGRGEFAVRLALICALTALVTEIYQTPNPALTSYVAFFMVKFDRTESVILSLVFLVLITLIMVTVILIAMIVVDEPFWRVLSMALISFGLLFAASASKLRPVAAIIALIVAYSLDLLGTLPSGELATRGLLYAWLFIGIPAGLSIVVNLLIGPSPRRLVEHALAHRLTLASAMLHRASRSLRREFEEAFAEGTQELQAWLRLAAVEKTSPPEDIAALRQAIISITPILLLVEVIDRDPERLCPRPIRDRLATTLSEMAAIFQRGGYPVDIAFDISESEATTDPDAIALRSEVQAALVGLTTPLAEKASAPTLATTKGGFFLPDAFTNGHHVEYALKTTAAAMFCYLTFSILDWPGIHTCLITCYIVSLTTTAETIEKLSLRILGCLIGAAAGLAAIVYLMPDVTSIGVLMAVVFLAAFASAWVAGGSPRIAYAGFQMAFAFFLCVIQGSSPEFSLSVARDRTVGILFGNLVVYLLFTNFRPASVAARVDQAIAALIGKLRDMMTAPGRPERWAAAAEAGRALGALEQDLELLHYEPRSVRPPRAWIDARRHAVHKVAALEGLLLVLANRGTSAGGQIRSKLEHLAEFLAAGDGGTRVEPPRTADVPKPEREALTENSPLEELAAARLQGFERALTQPSYDQRAARNAPA